MLALQLAALLLAAAPQKLDLVIEHGRVVDGSGSPWFRADVGIQGERIVRMGDLRDVPAKLRIDARDHLVAPGFIDLLGQSELSVLVDPRAESKIRQGITSELTGELGSVAPVKDEILGGVMGWLSLHQVKIDWKDLDGYWKRFRAARPAINLGTMVSTSQVRTVVMGQGPEAPTPDQLLRMQVEVQKAMRQGAFGVAASLGYPPTRYQTTDELVLLARSAAKFGGFYATHLRNEGDDVLPALDEAIDIGRRAGLPVEVWHLKVAGRRNWGRMPEVIQRIAAARAEGLDVTANVYPYLAGANMLHADVPDWAQAGGVSAMLARLRDREQRSRVEKEIAASWKDPSDPERVVVTLALSPDARRYEGKTLAEVAKERATTPAAVVVDLVLLDGGSTQVVRFLASEFDLREALGQSWVAVGVDASADAPDGPLAAEGTHPRAFGSMARLLGTYARDEKLFSFEEAVRKVTSGAARRLGLTDRGLLRPGMMADVVVFDPTKVKDNATYARPKQFPDGIETVLVNGQPVLVDGVRTEARPGRPLLHPIPDSTR
ncbi:MAG TPA: D-aminoacylase [Myxococcaceae bacterium]|nr:D-aminoacylase [Myxococcaceae bacterium]